MHLTARVRLTSYLLGDDLERRQSPGQPPIYRFRRTHKGWDVNTEWWGWLVRNSVSGSGLPLVAECIMPPIEIKLPTLHLLRTKHLQLPGRFDHYEAMRTGTVLSFDFALMTSPPSGVAPGLRTPGLDDLRAVFAYMGQYVGISPARSAHGYGRFALEDITETSPTVRN